MLISLEMKSSDSEKERQTAGSKAVGCMQTVYINWRAVGVRGEGRKETKERSFHF